MIKRVFTQVISPHKGPIGLIIAISASAFAFLVWLIYIKQKPDSPITAIAYLPMINCIFNTLCTLCILFGIAAIKNKNKKSHILLMISAFIFSSLFLITYTVYHSMHGDSLFLGHGVFKMVYFFILISHIGLTIVALPFILITFFFAITTKYELHRTIAKWTYSMWLYVSITGVLIYLFLKASGSL